MWDFERHPARHYPLLLNYPYFDLYRKQVVKQADLVMALFFGGDFSPPRRRPATSRTTSALTVRDSSLSACIQAVVAAEVGHLELAYDYFAEAALLDLDDLEHNTRDGVHIASLAGACIAALAGFGGLRDRGGRLTFDAPASRRRSLAWRSASAVARRPQLRVEVTPAQATYTLLMGDSLEIHHHGKRSR